MADTRLGEWLRRLESIHPTDIDLGLKRIGEVARRLGLLPFTPRTLTVAGTNGKGSVVYSSEALLRSHGKRTGRYTSPHLLSFNERIAVDGTPVADELVVAAFAAIDNARGEITLTYFEYATLAALWIFLDQKVDVVVLEVGLGGRLDATNVVDADVTAVTSIALDHQHWLGSTVELIGREKIAIARPARPCILAERSYPSSVPAGLREIGARMLRAGDEWHWRRTDEPPQALSIRLANSKREFQLDVPAGLEAVNVAAALQSVDALLRPDTLDEAVSRAALATLRVPARRQRLWVEERELVIDVAHNPAAMGALARFLNDNPVDGQTVAAMGLMADKDLTEMAALLASAVDGACALAIPGIDRAQLPEVVWSALDDAGVAIAQGEFSFDAVWRQLLTGTRRGDRLVVCGSFHSVAGILEATGLQPALFTPDVLEARG